jgi:GntR family transcriptional regulator
MVGVLTPEVKLLGCPAEIAKRLGIAAGDCVVSRQEERYIDRAAWSLQTTYYPMKWVSLGATGLLEAQAIPGGCHPAHRRSDRPQASRLPGLDLGPSA